MKGNTKSATYIEVNRPAYSRTEFDEFAQKKSAPPLSCCQQVRSKVQDACKCTRQSFFQKLYAVLPIINVIRTYKLKKYLVRDIVAGLTVGMIQIPQGMGFGILAGLSPVYGLYTSFFPVVIYTLFGNCKNLSVGTMAILSLVVSSVVEVQGNKYMLDRNMTLNNATCDNDCEKYKASIASAMALLSGAIMVVLGVLKLGAATALMPQPFISGFTTGAAFHIATSQMKSLLRIPVKGINGILKVPYTWVEIGQQISKSHVPTVVLVTVCVILLVFFREFINEKFKSKLPIPIPIEIIVLVLSTTFSYLFNFNGRWDIITIGPIPQGLPMPMIPPLEKTPDLIADAIIAAVLSLTISVSMAEIVGRDQSTTIDANQEFVAAGLCYGLSSFFSCFIGSVAPPRCFILSGSKTTLANVFTALLLLLVIVVIGPLFISLPTPALAAIIVVSLFPLFKQFKSLPHLWRVSKVDLSIWLVTWLSTILFNMDLGLMIGIGWSVLTLALTSIKGRGVLLGQTKHKDLFAPSETHNLVSLHPGVKIYRYESNLFFASVKNFKDQLFEATYNPKNVMQPKLKKTQEVMVIDANGPERALANKKIVTFNGNGIDEQLKSIDNKCMPTDDKSTPRDTGTTIKAIILDCSAFTYVDLMGMNTLKQLRCDYSSVNIQFVLVNCTQYLLHKLELSGEIGGQDGDVMCVYQTIQDAVAAVTQEEVQDFGQITTCL